MRTEVILLALLVILGLQNTIKPIGIDAKGVLECEGNPADIAFIIDSSRSIYAPDFYKGIAFLQSFVKIFQIGPEYVRIAAVSFGQRVITDSAFGFDQHNGVKEILRALKQIRFQPRYGGSTNTDMALIYARKNIFINARPNVKKIAIVLTDGRSDNFRKTKAEADRLKSQGVEIITIGVGRGVALKELKAMASNDEDIFRVHSYGALKNIKLNLGLITCKAITTPAPTTTTTTTQPPNAESCDGQPFDFNFVFDPGQLGTTGTNDTIRFIKTVVSAEDLKNGKIRVGTITGPCPETHGFHLNSYKNLPDIVTHFGTHRKTEIKMASLITDLRTEAFDPKNGGREKARKVGVLFLKGKLNNLRTTVSEAKLAKTKGIEIFIVNMGSLNREGVLESMASGKSTHILRASDSGGIINIARSLVAQICKGCNARPIDFNCVFDPAQMGKRGIIQTIRFIKNVLNSKKFEDGQIRAGIITDQATRVVPINRDTKPQDILEHFDNNTTTDMASLIAELRTIAFHPSNGGRVNARKIAVLFLKDYLRNPQETISELELTMKKGIELFIIDIGGKNDEIFRTARSKFWVDTKPRKWSPKKTALFFTRNICYVISSPLFTDIY